VLFRRFLVSLRRGRKLTQTQLGRRLGMSQVLVSRCEKGYRKVDVLEMREICRALKIDFVETIRDLDTQLTQHEQNPFPLVPPDPEPSRGPAKTPKSEALPS